MVRTKLEVLVVPVWDVDRARAFHSQLGWRDDITNPAPGR